MMHFVNNRLIKSKENDQFKGTPSESTRLQLVKAAHWLRVVTTPVPGASSKKEDKSK